jgi:hypothetical protein
MKKRIKKWKNKIFSKNWDAITLHRLILISLIFVFFLLSSALFLAGEKVKSEKYEIVNVKYPTKLERNMKKMVADAPIREMTPYIAKHDKKVAAYLVAIAKKESNWGKYSPRKNGKNCFNYWGYRGNYNQTLSGYSCFDSPEQAVDVVGGRIGELINQEVDTPAKMVVWKCGSNCNGHGAYSVQKWIRDVDFYYQKIYN